MHILSMALLLVLFLFSCVLCGALGAESVPTYERQDPYTGQNLTCAKCPPGTHMAAHCTASTPTKCAPCNDDHYTELWNYLPRCLYCSNFCVENEEVERECSATRKRVCRCKNGFYSTEDFCVRHSKCGPGYGVLTNGSSQMNTVCERCDEGYFSSSSSALDSCVNHQECADGQMVLLNGSAHHDTVCGTCQDLANGGDTSREFFSAFFSMHRMRVGKMRKFVARYIYRSAGERRVRGTALLRRRGPLMDQISVWLAEAPVEQLQKLPEMLEATQLTSMAQKLKQILGGIEQQCLSSTAQTVATLV